MDNRPIKVWPDIKTKPDNFAISRHPIPANKKADYSLTEKIEARPKLSFIGCQFKSFANLFKLRAETMSQWAFGTQLFEQGFGLGHCVEADLAVLEKIPPAS